MWNQPSCLSLQYLQNYYHHWFHLHDKKIFLTHYLISFKFICPPFLEILENSSQQVILTWLNLGNIQVVVSDHFITWSTRKPNPSGLHHYYHGEIHGTSAKRMSVTLLLINGRWYFKYLIPKITTFWNL